ncbi:hypothetical protein [Limnovirga soli]|uniref:Uncharacterized protein n=1 Tax=Limnovirga soli TaxID=2656915 RepID=A0A8J8JW45_9BACT|nr:hypothetical protein [Limnovirga soli]NNV54936.1 hypothetical protein [Limnovirga soli]
MEAISNKLRDFSGQNIYVGMDVHHKSWKVHIYSDEFELKSLSQEPDVDRLCNYLCHCWSPDQQYPIPPY